MKCKKCHRTQNILVLIPADLSHTGKERFKVCKIDYCIADIVKALQWNGICMRGSCCGHGKTDGEIQLQDGRTLVIKKGEHK
jgi:hypothetical protein